MNNNKLAAAQTRYKKAQAQSAELRKNIALGGSYALWRKAVAEEEQARERLQALETVLDETDNRHDGV